MIRSIPAKASTWRGAMRNPVGTSRRACEELFRRAIVLKEFRNHVLADHEIGQMIEETLMARRRIQASAAPAR